jgi:predicted AAA+ superfamily ATPase
MKRALYEELLRWKEREEHLPILLRGARQVGKSYLVEHFGESHFEDVAVVDFEIRPELKEAFSTKEPKEILTRLEFALRKPIKAGKTLLFLDEIQLCPAALTSLRYFKEKMPKLHVIAAGSLLEFLLKDEEYSFPVGRVEFLYLRPLSFVEYLHSVSPLVAERLEKFDLKNPPSELEHQELLKLARRYLFIGGMPAAVKESLKQESLLETQRVHNRILLAYEGDFAKYGKHTQYKYLQTIFRKAPALIAQILKFARIDPDTRSRELRPALELLCHAGLFQRVCATTAAGLPLHAHMKDDRFKLLYLDVGLLQTATKVDATHFFEQDILQINSGMLAEQFVGQELLAYAEPDQNASLLFWERNEGQAEVDFITTVGSDIIPIEVKAGVTGKLRSMHEFLREKKSRLGIRISEQPLQFQDKILSIPFYLIHSLNRLVRSL